MRYRWNMSDATTPADIRTHIVDVAARLLREGGAAAVTTRGVAQEAGVQAPAIYRFFGDKEGLLEAVAEHVMAVYVSSKAATVQAAEVDGVDPVADLRAGWRAQIDFGLANPTLFRFLSDPERVANSPAAKSGRQVLEARIHRVAVAGRLKVAEPRAVALFHAAGVGVITTMLATPTEERDPGLHEAVLDGVLAQILTGGPLHVAAEPLTTAIAFRAVAPTMAGLTSTERTLLGEWLDRIIAANQDLPAR